MAETTTLRVMAAAKEFNIGKETLIDFLVGKGFSKDDLKPTSKLTEEMYRSLQQEFQSDKVAKLKSDQIDLPKGSLEAKKKKEEEAVVFKKEIKKAEPAPAAVVEAPPPPVVVEEAPPVVIPPVVEEKKPEEKPEVVKLEAPEIEGPKVVAKIDLDAIDSSTRPKKTISKKKVEEVSEAVPEPVEEVKPVKKAEEPELPPVVEQKTEAQPEKEEVVKEETEKEEAAPVIENIKADKLTGPTILGKIQLPTRDEAQAKIIKPVPGNNNGGAGALDEKRKRKRIPIEKKDTQTPQQKAAHLFKKREPGDQQGGQQQQRGRGGHQGGGQQQGAGGGGNFRGGGGNRRGGHGHHGQGTGRGLPREAKEIDEKEIQNKIRETQAKLAGAGGRGKSMKAKYRREKRQGMAEQSGGDDMQDNKLQVTEFISVSELANLMEVSFAEVISKCMSLGLMVSINQRLDAEVIELVASEFGYDVEFIDMEKQMEMEEEEDTDEEDELLPRAPIVTIMGHVDHGKTSLLDYIRSANVVAGEAGGITQHIGAYEVTLANGKRITFLDTPGHEAFTAMRARGAKVTDIAVIVVAADDAVMPQTKEAISHAQAAGVPMIFAINKIDKDGANPQKIYEQLSGMNLLVEAWGGKYQNQELSAKKGLNVDLLLEKILLEAELLNVKQPVPL
jgi:translation initiation factor IF-2